jgi:hypothetical protein
MRPATAIVGAALGIALCVPAVAQVGTDQRVTDLQARLAQAIGDLDSARTEAAVAGLRSLINALRPADPVELRVTVHLRLGEAFFSLGERDSAHAQFTRAVAAKPFVILTAGLFNPEMTAVFEAARRAVSVLAIRVPRDTTLTPVTERLPVEVAVGRPGEVRVLTSGPGAAGRDSLVALFVAEGVVAHELTLLSADSSVLRAGTYRIRALLVEQDDTLVAALRVAIERLPVSLLPHEPPPGPETLLPEWDRGPMRARGLLVGALIGAAGALLPAVMTNRGLDNRAFEPRAAALGAAIAVGGAIGAQAGRPRRPIQANIDHNQRHRSAWQERQQAIEIENAERMRGAPLRIRVVPEGPGT